MSGDFATRRPWPEPSLMLTDAELDTLLVSHGKGDDGFHGFARAIERTVAERIVKRLEGACGATSLPPVVIKHLFLEQVP